MQLTYRGISYSSTPSTTEAPDTEITLQYRSNTIRLGLNVPALSLQPGQKLTYRGVQY